MNLNSLVRFAFAALSFAATTAYAGDPITFESGEAQTTLLELFTPEGCSSCPPADAWMSKLKTSGDLWTRIVPVVWHVDYWDRLGWRDRFAKPEFTARQHHYASEWQGDSVYTPAFVANGREWRGWFDHGGLPQASGAAGKLRIRLDSDRKVIATFKPVTQLADPLLLQVAALGANLQSNVAGGENGGRKLQHDFVVLATATAAMQRDGDSFTAQLTMPNEPERAAGLAAWIATGEAKLPIQATGCWLVTNK